MKNTIFLVSLFLFIAAPAYSDVVDPEFVHAQFSKTVKRLETAIARLNPKLNKHHRTKLATLISIESKRQNLDPRLVLAILDQESKFRQSAICFNKNGTKDVSIAQINLSVWNPKSFKFRTGHDLNVKRLKKDEAYAISRMCLILVYLRENYSPKDKWWFARYNSATPIKKRIYLSKLNKSFKKLKGLEKDLLKDMPSLDLISQVNSDSKIILASNGGKYE